MNDPLVVTLMGEIVFVGIVASVATAAKIICLQKLNVTTYRPARGSFLKTRILDST